MRERKGGWKKPEKKRSLDAKSYQLWIAWKTGNKVFLT